MAFNQLNALDFNDIKASIRDYLKSSDAFTDYNFEGSALSNLIDVLAYNTYYTAFNANLVVNEAFLDSAIIRENVVRLAKLLNYTPKSTTSAQAYVNISAQLPFSNIYPEYLILKSGICFTAFNENGSYVFSTTDDVIATVNQQTGVANFNNVRLYEGNLLTVSYIVDNSSLQRYIIPNVNADTSTLKVQVYETPQSTSSDLYTKSTNFVNLTPDSLVYFIQEVENQKYELIFGDDVFGKKLKTNNKIDITYIISNGKLGNNCSDFTGGFIGKILDSNDNPVSTGITVTNVRSSIGGGDQEGIDSIKYYAPRYFQSQDRAVTAKDYEALVPLIFSNIESIAVYGGEDELPPQYGTVKLVIKPKNGTTLSFSEKEELKKLLKNYSVASVIPEIKDPSVIYIELTSSVYYNPLLTTKNSDQIKQDVVSSLINLNTTRDFNKFGGKFKYSKAITLIDDSNPAITSNITKVRLRKNLTVNKNVFTSYLTCFANVLANLGSRSASIKSTGFKLTNEDQNKLFYFEDNSAGSINIYTFDSNGVKNYLPSNSNKKSFGTVNYSTGEVKIDPILISGTFDNTNTIRLFAVPQSNDIIAIRDAYLTIDIDNLEITVLEDIISSGQTTSGIGVIPAASQQ